MAGQGPLVIWAYAIFQGHYFLVLALVILVISWLTQLSKELVNIHFYIDGDF